MGKGKGKRAIDYEVMRLQIKKQYNDRIEDLSDQVKALKPLMSENEQLRKENESLAFENKQLKEEVAKLNKISQLSDDDLNLLRSDLRVLSDINNLIGTMSALNNIFNL